MSTAQDFPLPSGLPEPVDDGAADHLEHMKVPSVALRSTKGGTVDLSTVDKTRAVVYCYPMTGVPGTPLPEGWDLIPGARGCTPQTCSFRDHAREFSDLGADIFGVSTQTTSSQSEMTERLHVPFAILSDDEYKFCDALPLPTFEVEGKRLLKRLTLIIREGKIEHVFYPVFPPNESAAQVLRWLREHPPLE